MTAYYNEIDRFCCDWLSNLMDKGLITPGKIDDRSICDLSPDDVRGYERAHFFAGIAGWDLALRLAGWPDDRPVWTGSCPCQPFSVAGSGKASGDERHLWPDWFRLIRAVRPAVIFSEQVEAAIGWGWLDLVCSDLEAEGYTVGAAVLPACSVGAPHIRQRLWFVADAKSCNGRVSICERKPRQESLEPRGHGETRGLAGCGAWHDLAWLQCSDHKTRPTQPGLLPLAHGIPNRVGRLRAYGNAIVPQTAAAFIKTTQ